MKNQNVGSSIEYHLLRQRWKVSLTGGADYEIEDADIQSRLKAMDAEAGDIWDNMDKSVQRTCIWKDLTDPDNLYVRDKICLNALKRIEKLALVYSTKGSSFQDNQQLKEDMLSAMLFIYTNWYHENLRKGGEWWHKEIGIPLSINTCVLLLYDEMDVELREGLLRAVESFTANPHMMCIEDTPEVSTGANRVWKCLALAECGFLKENGELLYVASSEIKEIFNYTDGQDGFYKDGSFVQHLKFAYTGGYGLSFMKTIVEYMDLVRDTPWEVEGYEIAILQEWINQAYVPFLYKGGFMNMTQGREIARECSEEHKTGHQLIQVLLKSTNCLQENHAVALKEKIKYWIQEDTYHSLYTDASIDLIRQFKSLLQDVRIIPCLKTDFCKIYAGMDRVIHVRREFAFGISMSSERISKYESIHGENKRGWYTSEGTTYLYNADLAQYSEGYFPTINAYRMPGTTVDTLIREEEGVGFGQEPKLYKDWVGGCQLDDMYGSVGMEVEAYGSDLQAYKSWFLFNEEIVCLGAGITCSEGRKVETIVENRKINGKKLSEEAQKKGQAENFIQGNSVFGESTTETGKLIHFKGMVNGGDIGYYFPTDCQIETLEEIRTDSWSSINGNSGTAQKISNAFASIVISHGIDPKEAVYQYMILPNVTTEQLEAYGTAPEVEILENSKRVQAVRQKKLGITGANFWTDEISSVGGITCHGKASVMLREEEEKITLSASDPTWHNEQQILVELEHAAAQIIARDETIKVLQMTPTIKLSIETKNAMGKSFQIELKKIK